MVDQPQLSLVEYVPGSSERSIFLVARMIVLKIGGKWEGTRFHERIEEEEKI